MNKWIVLFVASLSLFTHAYTQQEELEVVLYLSLRIQTDWEDDLTLESSTNSIVLTLQTYDDLFASDFQSKQTGHVWTAQEQRQAFENFIWAIPELSTNGMYKAIYSSAGIALGFCHECGRTNMLGAAMRIIVAKNSAAQESAVSMFEDWAMPSDSMNEYVQGVMTNTANITMRMRSDVLNGYALALKRCRTSCPPAVFTNGVSIVASSVIGRDGAIAVDRLLLDAYPAYEHSSNRLEIARSALADTCRGEYSAPALKRYFVPITNQLMNATHPLGVIEGL